MRFFKNDIITMWDNNYFYYNNKISSEYLNEKELYDFNDEIFYKFSQYFNIKSNHQLHPNPNKQSISLPFKKDKISTRNDELKKDVKPITTNAIQVEVKSELQI